MSANVLWNCRTQRIQAETNATVMAMEKGAKQMQRGLALLEHVAEATAQVRLTTQQQRSATAQVVATLAGALCGLIGVYVVLKGMSWDRGAARPPVGPR